MTRAGQTSFSWKIRREERIFAPLTICFKMTTMMMKIIIIIIIIVKIIKQYKVKVKVTLVQTLRLCTGRTAHRGSRGIALLFHDHGTRRE